MPSAKKKEKTRDLRDAFRPRPFASRDQELARSRPSEVIDILSPHITDERRARIDAVISHRTKRLAVALEGVHDPHNAAAVVRSADAFGVLHVHIVQNGVRFRASRKVTQGSHKWIDLSVWGTSRPFVDAMKARGARILVAAMDAELEVAQIDLATPTVLVFGNEAEGVSDEMRALADGAFRIPMYGFVESFNVSVAAAIAISSLRAGGGGDLSPAETLELRALYYLRAARAAHEIVTFELERRSRPAPAGDRTDDRPETGREDAP